MSSIEKDTIKINFIYFAFTLISFYLPAHKFQFDKLVSGSQTLCLVTPQMRAMFTCNPFIQFACWYMRYKQVKLLDLFLFKSF